MWSKKFSGLINPTGGKYIGPIPAMTASNHRHFLLFKLFLNCYLLSSQVISEETNTLNAPFQEHFRNLLLMQRALTQAGCRSSDGNPFQLHALNLFHRFSQEKIRKPSSSFNLSLNSIQIFNRKLTLYKFLIKSMRFGLFQFRQNRLSFWLKYHTLCQIIWQILKFYCESFLVISRIQNTQRLMFQLYQTKPTGRS